MNRPCWPCILVGIGSVIYAGAVCAQTVVSTGPTCELIAMGSIGLVMAMMGAYLRGLSGRVDELSNLILKEYHSKQDVNAMFSDLKNSINHMTDRLEELSDGRR